MRARFSIVIPVWNGAAVISQCLESVFANADDELLEVVCVDNGSHDDSAARIASQYPQVGLIRQPVNLGFAGGVNAGMAAARGHVFILLNQDCLPEHDWLSAIGKAFEDDPQAGIAGCTILHADGSLDHAGARMVRPLAYGEHFTDVASAPRTSDYVTGAAFAIRREVIERIGGFDEDFYPAYYEETDFCYRARVAGFETIYAPAARIRHLRSSNEAHKFPVRHAANQHRSRLRFVLKHWSQQELVAFFDAEDRAVATEPALNQAIGRVLAMRDTLRDISGTLAARERDGNDALPPAYRRLIEVRCTDVLRQSFARAETLAQTAPIEAIRGEGATHVSGRLKSRMSALTTKLGGNTVDAASLSRRLALLEALVDYEFR
jgi:GT2 family glycosyltransferase